jgi:hypothetical protein
MTKTNYVYEEFNCVNDATIVAWEATSTVASTWSSSLISSKYILSFGKL